MILPHTIASLYSRVNDGTGRCFLTVRGIFVRIISIRLYLWETVRVEKKRLAAVVFDCDGVLMETNAVKTRAFGQTVAEYGQGAVDKLMAYHMEHGGISRVKKFEWFFREVIKAPVTDEAVNRLCRRFSRLCRDGVLKAPMVAGARDSLEFLQDRLPLFVASGAPQKELSTVLTQKGLAPFFKGIHGTPPEKQYLLEQILRDNRLDGARVLMVGDAATDLGAAEYCGTWFYGRGERFAAEEVPWGRDLTGFVPYLTGHFTVE